MQTENNRLECAMKAFHALSETGTDLDRLFSAMASLNEILLTGASEEVRQAVEELGVQYNSICEQYPPDAFQPDRVSFSETDAADLIATMTRTIEVIRDAETERILNRLRHQGGKLPKAEIIEARRHREWFTRILISEFRDEIDRFKQNPNPDQRSTATEHSDLPFLAFYLFSEWNTLESVPVILDSLSLPNDDLFDLLGDGIHEQLSHYLAQFLSHDIFQIDSIICNPDLNEYVRWAAVTSYGYLVRDQNISIEDAVVRLERLFHATKLSDADGNPAMGHCFEVSAAILDMLHTLGCSMQNIVSNSRDWDFVELSIFRSDLAATLTESEVQQELERLSPTRISDCLEILSHWACFNRETPKPVIKSDTLRTISSASPNSFTASVPSFESRYESTTGTIRKAEQTPRNAKCPCGSGKKFKQCCLRK